LSAAALRTTTTEAADKAAATTMTIAATRAAATMTTDAVGTEIRRDTPKLRDAVGLSAPATDGVSPVAMRTIAATGRAGPMIGIATSTGASRATMTTAAAILLVAVTTMTVATVRADQTTGIATSTAATHLTMIAAVDPTPVRVTTTIMMTGGIARAGAGTTTGGSPAMTTIAEAAHAPGAATMTMDEAGMATPVATPRLLTGVGTIAMAAGQVPGLRGTMTTIVAAAIAVAAARRAAGLEIHAATPKLHGEVGKTAARDLIAS